MKALIIALLLLGAGIEGVVCQTIITKEYDVGRMDEIQLDFDFADDIIITGWDQQKVQLKIEVSINDNEDNDKFIFEEVEKDGALVLKTGLEEFEGDRKGTQRICLSKDGETGHYVYHGNHYDMEIYYELFVPRNMDLSLSTISGNLEIIGFEGACNLESISGDIDMTIAGNSHAEFEMSTISGSVYTDLELTYEGQKDDMRILAGRDISAKLNNGGREIELETISGNIYLRNKN